jgi:hypothetical protein
VKEEVEDKSKCLICFDRFGFTTHAFHRHEELVSNPLTSPAQDERNHLRTMWA